MAMTLRTLDKADLEVWRGAGGWVERPKELKGPMVQRLQMLEGAKGPLGLKPHRALITKELRDLRLLSAMMFR